MHLKHYTQNKFSIYTVHDRLERKPCLFNFENNIHKYLLKVSISKAVIQNQEIFWTDASRNSILKIYKQNFNCVNLDYKNIQHD